MKKFAILLLLVGSWAFAADEALCAELCEPCRGSSDASCQNVENVCHCAALFEKLAREEAARAAAAEKRKAAVERVLYEACKTGTCTVGFQFEGAKVKKFTPKDAAPVAAVKEPTLKPLAAECVELCRTLPPTPDPNNAVHVRIDGTCGCSSHLEDSLKIEAFRAVRLAGAKNSAETLVKFCSGKDPCRAQVAMNPETFEPLSVVEPPSAQPPEASPQASAPKEPAPDDLSQKRLDAVGNSLYEACAKGKCLLQVKFDEELMSLKTTKRPGREAVPEPAPKEPSSECADLCRSVSPGGAMNSRIEAACGCSALEAGNAELEEFRSVRRRNSEQAADSLVKFCEASKSCSVELSLDETTFRLEKLDFFQEAELEAIPTPVQTAERESKSGPSSDGAAGPESQKKNPLEPREVGPKASARQLPIFYMGVSLYGGMPFMGGDAYGMDDDFYGHSGGGFGANFGLAYVFRWYFYRWGSFQTGLGASYNYANLGTYHDRWDNANVSVHNISAEIPLQVRLGAFGFYGTFLFTVKKPIWDCINYHSYDGYGYWVRGMDHWEFLGHIGVGFEFTRHFALEGLVGLFDAGTTDDYAKAKISWRVKLDFAW